MYQSPGWTGSVTTGHDACLFRLAREPACFGQADGPKPIRLDDGLFWPRFSAAPHLIGTVIGWGSLFYGGAQSLTLQELDVNLYTADQCDDFYGWGAFYSASLDSNLCAGHCAPACHCSSAICPRDAG